MMPTAFDHLLSLALTAASCLVLGVFVLAAAPRERLNQTYALFCGNIAVWAAFQGVMMLTIHDLELARSLSVAEHVGVVLIPVLFLHYTLLLAERPAHRMLRIHYGIALVFLILVLLPIPWIVGGVDETTYAAEKIVFVEPGPLYGVMMAWFFIPVLTGLNRLWGAYRNSTGARRNQMKYVFWGALIGYFGGCGNYLYVYDVPIPWFNPNGTYGVPIYMGMTAYAIVRHRLMDINVVIKKTFLYTLLYSACLAVFGFVVFALGQRLLLGAVDPRMIWLSMAGVLLVVTMVRPLDRFLTRMTDRLLFRERYRYQQTLKTASAGMGRIRSLPKLLTLIARVIVNSVRISHATIFLKRPGKPFLSVVASRGPKKKPVGLLRLEADSPIVARLERHAEPIVCEELREQRREPAVVAEMERLEAAVCVPSFIDQKLIGLFLLGEKRSGDMYNTEDLDIFSTLANQAALAIENAQAYAELIHTRDQLLQSERLATIGKFASDMAHEIKNPLQAIMTFFEALPERYENPDFRNRFARIAHGEARRIDQLVKDLVHYTRPRPPRLESVDLEELIGSVLALLENDLQKRRIAVIRQVESGGEAIVEADRDQMKQVFLNLIINAIDAMGEVPERKHTLTVTLLPTPEVLQVEVRDTGCGIPEKHRSALTTPFFTTKEKGSGLGLAIVRNILEGHHASLHIDSRVGEGSAFTLHLPRRQPGSLSRAA